jgi:predicted ATPase
MQLREVHVEGYRSLKSVHFSIDRLTVLVGKNSAGKTNLYRSLMLLQAAADGRICRHIAEEGGIESVLWAGPREKLTPRLALAARFDEIDYRIEIGMPGLTEAALDLEPLVRAERLIRHRNGRPEMMLDRQGPTLWQVGDPPLKPPSEMALLASETALAAASDRTASAEIGTLRQTMLGWRFYHDIRTDDLAPIRQPSLGLSCMTLAPDGSDLASLFSTLFYVVEDPGPIQAALNDAFPGAELIVSALDGRCRFAVRFRDLDRPFAAHELSEGTLRYLFLMGVLMGGRLPPFIAINEPENGLNAELLPPLARLIAQAASRTQVWIVTHSEALARELAIATRVLPRHVVKEDGATRISDAAVVSASDLGSLAAAVA